MFDSAKQWFRENVTRENLVRLSEGFIYGTYNWLTGDSRARAEFLPPEPEQRDAYMHADVSASMVYQLTLPYIGAYPGQVIARVIGDAKEGLGGLANINSSAADSRKDIYNNYIGRQIGRYAVEHHLYRNANSMR